MRRNKIVLLAALVLALFVGCDDEPQLQTPQPEPEYDMTGFAKGADVSWLTEMESDGVLFYDANGKQTECMHLLRDLGMNSIRLRVWVNPTDGWCNMQDVLVKAWRANQLGMRIMIDFHYSDSWADPGKQNKPSAWADLSFDDLKTAVADHTTEVLTLLKQNGITPEWVQVGNETGNGMLWDDGKASENMAQYAALNNAGYDAVKTVFPDALVVIHLQEGNKNSMYEWLFDGLESNGGKWDVIGMSLYPSADDWESLTSDMISNMNDMISRYGTPVMVCETGMPWDDAETSYAFLSNLLVQCKAIADDQCLGVLYWEPQAYNGWNDYTLGAFDESGKPTVALDAFAE
ncbi:glycoside hydrolase family 53 protein [Mangrovibacterium diazotrophicum]|uniref:Arabinogalactan endo-beta-1,4-galactanase n=1 Tax=Mangrovibacterium diazotrophicum TaxID=1261403 RepID=A0A419WAK2_9BACT|nr:glycosyl hydrolase 53 family protein [Mangrovibacterium diazotrophicum]RKD92432.1 arabinogalactan endo-1,4-beta-galactosidase [Mangrovibacterium diazotrophicum]